MSSQQIPTYANGPSAFSTMGTNDPFSSRLELILQPFDVAAAHAFDFAAQLQVAPDFVVVEHAEAIDDGERFSDGFVDLVGIKLEVRFMAHGQDDGIHTFHGWPEIFLDAQVLQRILP